jgi:hypothetical protein
MSADSFACSCCYLSVSSACGRSWTRLEQPKNAARYLDVDFWRAWQRSCDLWIMRFLFIPSATRGGSADRSHQRPDLHIRLALE